VPRRSSVFLVVLRLGSDSWCASSLSNKTMQYRPVDGTQHDRSILHLDLKPGNVLLTWDEGILMYA
jgi:serine/threonine protein kinase